MTVQDFEHSLLALACWREVGEASIDAMLCVAHTIMNLAKRDGIGVGDAILSHRELHNLQKDESTYPDVRDPRIAKMIQRVGDIDTQYSEDLTSGAVYYLDLGKPVAKEMKFLLEDEEAHPRVATCGALHFFK